MLLAFDVGNTNIVCGVYDGDNLIQHWRLATDTLQTADGYAGMFGTLFDLGGIKFLDITDVIIATVVPPIIPLLEKLSKKYFHCDPILVGPGIKTGLNILYDNPRELGADRIVNAVAAINEYGAPLIIIDMGTATTFCVVDSKKRYLGGAVALGAISSMEALFQRASKLPRIELVKTDSVICRNTVSAMQAGIYYGFVGQIDELVKRIKSELGEEKVKVVATGGLSSLIAEETQTIDVVDPMLTLKGLLLLYKKNKK
ncbi:type III pantothenate kinase [Dialister micraerophilus]|uniref:type III pantothenate kinase n=1 Tax=Dialister micraerophilus TaxID=309120 RepID=UPI0023EF796B|nr:type III pantothenate kinase [Dialister micraerophilus]